MKTIEELAAAFEQFKNLNDTRLAEIEKTGSPDAATQEAVNRANADITALQEKLTQERNSTDEKLAEFEDRLNRTRTSFGGKLDDETLTNYAAWQGVVQNKRVSPSDVDIDMVRSYSNAFDEVLRRGDRASGESLRIVNAMSVGSDPDGGYWVDPDTSGRVATLLRETSPVRQYANVQTISSDSLEGTTDLNEAGHGGWVGETETRSGDTDTPQVGTWKIPAHEHYAEPRATQKLLDDAAIDVEGWLAGKVTSKFARIENTAFVTGSGVARPRGFTTYTAGTPSASDWQKIEQVVSGSAAALTADGLIDLVFSLKSGYRGGSIFAMNRTTEREVRQLTDGQSNYLWQPDFTQMGASTLLGFPIVEFADMADIAANALPIAFGNFGEAYQIVDRMGIRVLRDPYTTKGYVKFYTTKRVGGDVVNFEAIKIQKCST